MNGISIKSSVGEGAGKVYVPKDPGDPGPDQTERALRETQAHEHALEAAGLDESSSRARRRTADRPRHDFSVLPPEKVLVMAERCSRNLAVLGAKRAEVAHRVIEAAMALDTRKSFLQNRAVAVVYATLLHLEDGFREVGFGSWMPFRYPDQWLRFCGVMQRVLAANGLIHSRNAETYRKLLDETPPVEQKDDIDERIQKARTPANMAMCARNQGAETMAELEELLAQKRAKNLGQPP